MEPKRTHPDSAVIDLLGGTAAVAKLCDLTDSAVSQWRNAGISKGWRRFLMEKHPSAFDLSGSPQTDAVAVPGSTTGATAS